MDPRILIAAAGLALPAAATDYTQYEQVWIEPAPRAAEASATPCRRIGLLTLPPLWQPGDAAVVLLSPPGGTGDDGARVAASLLGQGSAVLELAARGPCAEPGSDADPGPVAALCGGLRALREQYGAGLVVAIGVGGVAPAALVATGDGEAAAPRLGEAAPGFVAGVALHADGTAAMRPGATPAPRERWDLRAPLFCALLREAVPAAAEACDGLYPGPRLALPAPAGAPPWWAAAIP